MILKISWKKAKGPALYVGCIYLPFLRIFSFESLGVKVQDKNP